VASLGKTTEMGPPAWAAILSWALVGTVDQRDPAGRAAALAQHVQAHIVKVDASTCHDLPPRSGDWPDRRRCPQHQLKGQRVVMVTETGKEPTR
jgi:hypothetical protein